jgi:GTP-binding protein
MGDHETHGHNLTDGSVPDESTTHESGPDAEALESARKLFAQECQFVTGAADLGGLPEDKLPEIAFAGRSNVGKSSLVNALTGRKTLARTSNTPGRTRQINFFDLGGRLMLVDLPGYGYARAAKTEVAAWTRLIQNYLKGRVGLRRLCLLVDGRHGLKPSDEELMDLLENAAVPYRVVLTKCDKLKSAALAARVAEVENALRKRTAALPQVLPTSAIKKRGIAELRADLAELAGG